MYLFPGIINGIVFPEKSKYHFSQLVALLSLKCLNTFLNHPQVHAMQCLVAHVYPLDHLYGSFCGKKKNLNAIRELNEVKSYLTNLDLFVNLIVLLKTALIKERTTILQHRL